MAVVKFIGVTMSSSSHTHMHTAYRRL